MAYIAWEVEQAVVRVFNVVAGQKTTNKEVCDFREGIDSRISFILGKVKS